MDTAVAAPVGRGRGGLHARALRGDRYGEPLGSDGQTGGRAHLRNRHYAAPDADATAGIHVHPAEPGDQGRGRPRREDRRPRSVHEGGRRRGHHRREARADTGDHGQQPHHRRDARNGQAHCETHGLARPGERQGDDRRGNRCDRLGVLATARGGRQGRRAGFHRAGPAVRAQAEDTCRGSWRDGRDRPDDESMGRRVRPDRDRDVGLRAARARHQPVQAWRGDPRRRAAAGHFGGRSSGTPGCNRRGERRDHAARPRPGSASTSGCRRASLTRAWPKPPC